jgi:hypothetical protein
MCHLAHPLLFLLPRKDEVVEQADDGEVKQADDGEVVNQADDGEVVDC